MSVMGQTSRSCMVCLMRLVPSRLSMDSLRQLGGSSALMLRCTLTSRCSSRSLHSSIPAAFAIVLMRPVRLMKLFRDFRRGTTHRCPLSGCLWYVVCRVRSAQLVTALLMYDWAIGASTGRLLVFVGIRQILIFFFFRVLHTIFSHLRAHAFACSVTVARSSAVQAWSSRRQERRWAIVCGSPQSQSTDWVSPR